MVFFQFHIVIAEIKQDFKVGETAVGINVVVIGADFPAESFDDDSLNVFEMLLVVVEPIGVGKLVQRLIKRLCRRDGDDFFQQRKFAEKNM